MSSSDTMKKFKEKLKSNKKVELEIDPNENFNLVKEDEVNNNIPQYNK